MSNTRKYKDRSGERFGKWLVLERVVIEKSGIYWLCRCDCGHEQVIYYSNLIQKYSTQCKRCDSNSRILPNGEAALNTLFLCYKRDAARRNKEWNLTKEEFRYLTSQPCYYTGLPPSSIQKAKASVYVYNGIDRVDNSKGYTLDNCVPCFSKINEMKWDLSLDDFIKYCRLVIKKFDEKHNDEQRTTNVGVENTCSV